MTEQEKRDKAFYPMIMAAYPLGADYPEVAAIQRLIDAGYRKEEEVQKETAIKILNRLVDIAEKFLGDDYKGIFAAQVAIEMGEVIKKEFGVGAEE